MSPSNIKVHEHLQTRMTNYTVLNICDVLDALGIADMDYMESGKVLMTWCRKHNVHYYARPHEQFFVTTAVDEAIVAGRSFVVVEDMS